jgi:hypothetical protein
MGREHQAKTNEESVDLAFFFFLRLKALFFFF